MIITPPDLDTFLWLGQNTQHSKVKREEVHFGSQFTEVSDHSQLDSRQGSMAEENGWREQSMAGHATGRGRSREQKKYVPSGCTPSNSPLTTRFHFLTSHWAINSSVG